MHGLSTLPDKIDPWALNATIWHNYKDSTCGQWAPQNFPSHVLLENMAGNMWNFHQEAAKGLFSFQWFPLKEPYHTYSLENWFQASKNDLLCRKLAPPCPAGSWYCGFISLGSLSSPLGEHCGQGRWEQHNVQCDFYCICLHKYYHS